MHRSFKLYQDIQVELQVWNAHVKQIVYKIMSLESSN